MRKEIVLFALIFLTPFVLGAELSLSTDILQGQTAIVKVSGAFIDPITEDNIEFYRGYTRTSFDYDVGRIGQEYYIYFQTLNKPENNYSINISNVRYYDGAQISTEPFSQSFSILSTPADFYISPGFILSDGNFSLFVKNLYSFSNTISISSSFDDSVAISFKDNDLTSQDSFTLSAVEDAQLYFSNNDLNETTVGTITLYSSTLSYSIPVYLVLESQGEIPKEKPFNYSEENESVSETKNESTGSFWDLFKKENKTETNTTVIKDENGTILEKDTTLKTCAQLKGTVCQSNQICQDGNSVDAKDSKCCISSCVEKTQTNTKKIIGWSLVGIIILFLLWFRVKYNRTRRRRYSLPSTFKKRF